jgi:hypothetical protein
MGFLALNRPKTYVFHFFLSRFGFLIEFYYKPELEMNKVVLEKKNSDFDKICVAVRLVRFVPVHKVKKLKLKNVSS